MTQRQGVKKSERAIKVMMKGDRVKRWIHSLSIARQSADKISSPRSTAKSRVFFLFYSSHLFHHETSSILLDCVFRAIFSPQFSVNVHKVCWFNELSDFLAKKKRQRAMKKKKLKTVKQQQQPRLSDSFGSTWIT